MRILQVASGDFFSSYGGGQVYVRNIVDCMSDMGKDVSVLSFTGSDRVQKKAYSGCQLVGLPETASESDIAAVILELKPDIIHGHSHKDILCRIGKHLGIPVVITSHHGGILCPAGTRLDCNDCICHKQLNHRDCLPCVLRNVRTGLRWWYPFMRFLPKNAYVKFGQLLRKSPFIPFVTPVGLAASQIESKLHVWGEICEKCALMIAPCHEVGRVMTENGLDPRKLRVVPHGVPLPNVRPEYPEIVDGRLNFYYVGRISYVKGIHILLQAFSAVNNPDIKLHIIGGAATKTEKRYLKSLKRRFGGDTRVIWHGKVAPELVYKTTQGFHVSVAPSIYLEIFGLNIAESLALGKPVLASRSGGAEMQIVVGRNGWLVPTNDAGALAAKIAEISTMSNDEMKRMSARCKAIPIEEHCEALCSIYSEIHSKNNQSV